MHSYLTKLRQLELVRDTRGLSTVEYVIILALIAVVAVSSIRVLVMVWSPGLPVEPGWRRDLRIS